MHRPNPALWLAMLLLPSLSLAQVYTWTDGNGVLQFSDKPPAAAELSESDVRTIEVPQIETVSVRQIPADALPGVNTKDPAARHKRVILYSAEWCGVCKRAKSYFKRAKIAYQERDIDKSPSARREFRRLGGHGVPLILVGQRRLSGFSPGSFEKIYRN